VAAAGMQPPGAPDDESVNVRILEGDDEVFQHEEAPHGGPDPPV
jgi:hypothetical protein